MFNIQYSGIDALPNINKVTIDYLERPMSYSFEDMLREANNPDSDFKKGEFLLKTVYDGQGGNEVVRNHIKKVVDKARKSLRGGSSNSRLQEEDIYPKLVDELNRFGDYNDDIGDTNSVSKFVLGTVLPILMKSLSTPGSANFDAHYFSDDFITESEQSIDDGVFSTEALISMKGKNDNLSSFLSPEESVATDEEKAKARIDLVKGLELLYDFQISSSSIKDETKVTNLLAHLQQVDALEIIQDEVNFVSQRLGKDNKDALSGGSRPDSRKNRRMSKNTNQSGEEDKYHARIVLSAIYKDFSKNIEDRVYCHAVTLIANSCAALEIPLPMLDAQEIMRAVYIREMYSSLNGKKTLNITEYDLLEYRQTATYADVYTEAIKQQVRTIKVNGSTIPDSKMHIVITPSVKEAIRNIKLGELKQFTEFVRNTSMRGVEVWKQKDSSNAEINIKTAVDQSEERKRRKIDDSRMAATGVDLTKGDKIQYKKGPAHPDTLNRIMGIIGDYKMKLMTEGSFISFEQRAQELQKVFYESASVEDDAILEWHNGYLFNKTKNDYVRFENSNFPFNKRHTDDPEGDNYCDYLMHKSGFFVSNYISCYFPYLSETKYITNLVSEFSGLMILSPDMKLIHQE